LASEYLNNKNFEIIICKFQESKRTKTKYELIIEDLEGSSQRRGDTGRLVVFMEKYKVIVKEYEEYKEQLAYAFYTLSKNIAEYAKFNLIDVDDAISEGVLICFDKIDRFDPSRGKAFNYFTTCTLNTLRQSYRTARNFNELKRKFSEHLLSTNHDNVRFRAKNHNLDNLFKNAID
jgi:hypothetical protein